MENRQALYGEQEGHCAACDTHFELRHLETDYIIARSKGGTDHPQNLQLLCGYWQPGMPCLVKLGITRKGRSEKMRNLGLPAKPRKERFLADVRLSCEELDLSGEEALSLGKTFAQSLVVKGLPLLEMIAALYAVGRVKEALGEVGQEVGLERGRHFALVGICYMKHFFPSWKAEAKQIEAVLRQELEEGMRRELEGGEGGRPVLGKGGQMPHDN